MSISRDKVIVLGCAGVSSSPCIALGGVGAWVTRRDETVLRVSDLQADNYFTSRYPPEESEWLNVRSRNGTSLLCNRRGFPFFFLERWCGVLRPPEMGAASRCRDKNAPHSGEDNQMPNQIGGVPAKPCHDGELRAQFHKVELILMSWTTRTAG